MKIQIPLAILSVVLLSSACFAQDTPPSSSAPSSQQAPPPHHPDFLTQVDLTPDQQSKIQTIKDTVKDRKEKHDQIMAVLTPDQKTKYDQLMKAWKAAHPKPTPSGGDSKATSPAATSPAPAQ